MSDTIDVNVLREFVQRVQRLVHQRNELNTDLRAVYAEAKTAGFDTKALRAVVAELGADDDKQRALRDLIDTYRDALNSRG